MKPVLDWLCGLAMTILLVLFTEVLLGVSMGRWEQLVIIACCAAAIGLFRRAAGLASPPSHDSSP